MPLFLAEAPIAACNHRGKILSLWCIYPSSVAVFQPVGTAPFALYLVQCCISDDTFNRVRNVHSFVRFSAFRSRYISSINERAEPLFRTNACEPAEKHVENSDVKNSCQRLKLARFYFSPRYPRVLLGIQSLFHPFFPPVVFNHPASFSSRSNFNAVLDRITRAGFFRHEKLRCSKIHSINLPVVRKCRAFIKIWSQSLADRTLRHGNCDKF